MKKKPKSTIKTFYQEESKRLKNYFKQKEKERIVLDPSEVSGTSNYSFFHCKTCMVGCIIVVILLAVCVVALMLS